MDIDEVPKTRPKKPNLAEIREKLLHQRMTEAFTDYCGIESDPNLTLEEKIIKLQEAINDATSRRFTMRRFRDNYLKIAFVNQRKPTREPWSRSI